MHVGVVAVISRRCVFLLVKSVCNVYRGAVSASAAWSEIGLSELTLFRLSLVQFVKLVRTDSKPINSNRMQSFCIWLPDGNVFDSVAEKDFNR